MKTQNPGSLRIAILGTRGIPANYGGFETFAEELSVRLAERGHSVTVYGRLHYVSGELNTYRGVQLRGLPAIRTKYLDTVSHTCLSVVHALFRPYDVVLICNAANAVFSWIPRLRGQKVVLNVDGLERLRDKWSWVGKEFYRVSERLATLLPNSVVTDARTVQGYYSNRFRFETRFIPYGAAVDEVKTDAILGELGVSSGRFLLYVSRLEPENNAHRLISAYARAQVESPLVLVGDAPYSRSYIAHLRQLAGGLRVMMPGAIYGRGYRELLAHCRCYFHGCGVGGTHPALLEAMGSGALVISHDTPENREVLGPAGLFCSFEDAECLAALIRQAEDDPARFGGLRRAARERAAQCYDWEKVVDQYEELFCELVE